ncbi:RidA family protein [Ruminococcaceae bacterium OttesenSCG-928-A16]|nr:RidA family protein [Ruminococcaceae bacterium OttesenSCG-928-A16]
MKKNEIRRTGGNGRRSGCVAYNGILYTSGITTVDLQADIAGQAENIFSQLDRLMAFHNTSKGNILSATVYLKNMADYGAFNAIWDAWITHSEEPARSVVEASLALPEYLVKIALTVAMPD